MNADDHGEELPTVAEIKLHRDMLRLIHGQIHGAQFAMDGAEEPEELAALRHTQMEWLQGLDSHEAIEILIGISVSVIISYEGMSGIDHSTIFEAIYKGIDEYVWSQN